MKKILTSLVITIGSCVLAYSPIPGLKQSLIIVSGSELEEPLRSLETRFEQKYPHISIEVKIQGSQDIVNHVIDSKNDFKPTVLIPANGDILYDLELRWKSQYQAEPFYDSPQPIVRTLLVAIAWPERGKVLFPDGKFNWKRLETAMQEGSWEAIGGNPSWGSFDFRTTDPVRSNSGQLTLSLWATDHLGKLDSAGLNSVPAQRLFDLVKRSVYQPPRSTDILLQEFISRGPNDADVATVYESIALHRWEQAGTNQGKPYQIYYLSPTIDTTSTAVILRKDVSLSQAAAARTWINFLREPAQQEVFVQYGFRPIDSAMDIKEVPQSPWNQQIPGAAVNPPAQTIPNPDRGQVEEIIRQWERAKG